MRKKQTKVSKILKAHAKCVDLSALYASNLQGDDTKLKIGKSLADAEHKFLLLVLPKRR